MDSGNLRVSSAAVTASNSNRREDPSTPMKLATMCGGDPGTATVVTAHRSPTGPENVYVPDKWTLLPLICHRRVEQFCTAVAAACVSDNWLLLVYPCL
jgi:hypothetical protein